MVRWLKKITPDGSFFAVLMISLTAIITMGVFIPRLGYYHDDWYMLWSAAFRGPRSLIGLFSMDRPFMGYIYTVYYYILGDSPAGWHIVALLWRIAGACAFTWILQIVWPKLKSLAVLAGMLFVVFPGFLAQPNAATKINHLTGYTAALFSIAFTLASFATSNRRSKIVFSALALGSMGVYLWIYEYMIGLEVMRLALMLWMRWRGERGRLIDAGKKLIIAYLPYVGVLALFLYWRVFVFESTRIATDMTGLVDSYQADFAGMALRLIFQTIKDFLSVTVYAWGVQAYTLFIRSSYTEILIAFLVTVVVALAAVWYMATARKAASEESDLPAPFVLVLIGALSTLAAVFPVVLSDRRLDLMDAYKGYGLHPSAGVIIMVIGVILALKPNFRKSAWVTLLALALLTQALNAQRWGNFWDIQRNFWWQLSWRAPAIEKDTLLMALIPEGYGLQQDYEVWGPVSLLYHQGPLDYPPVQSEVLNQGTAVQIFNETFQPSMVRDIPMPRNYANLLLASQPTTQSCMHIIDGGMTVYSASERLIIEKVGAYSNTDHIDPSAAPPTPPAAIFGKEPPHDWCYYYQQASLARQTGDWQRISALYDTAAAETLHPADPSEYFVFLEGLVNAGRVEEAQKIANNAIVENEALRYSICESLRTTDPYPAAFGYQREQIQQIVCE